jgi:hypothetical protein
MAPYRWPSQRAAIVVGDAEAQQYGGALRSNLSVSLRVLFVWTVGHWPLGRMEGFF